MKRCPKCEQSEPVVVFNKGQGWCRACQKAWRQANPAKVRGINKAYTETHRERVNQWNRECYARHHDERQQAAREKYIRRKPQHLAVAKVWRSRPENKPKLASYWNKHHAEKFGPDADLTAAEWLEVLNTHNHQCVYCRGTEDISMDHVIPLSRGGRHTKANVEPACLRCNRRKGARTKQEFLDFLVQHALEHL